jgi:hypothetical protein
VASERKVLSERLYPNGLVARHVEALPSDPMFSRLHIGFWSELEGGASKQPTFGQLELFDSAGLVRDDRWLCLDCGIDTGVSGNVYMVEDHVWLEANPDDGGFLCLACLRARLGRGSSSRTSPTCPSMTGFAPAGRCDGVSELRRGDPWPPVATTSGAMRCNEVQVTHRTWLNHAPDAP